MCIVRLYKYCLLKVDNLAGVFSVVPNCSYPSATVAWSSSCFSAASTSELTLASFKTPALEEAAAEMGSCSAAPNSHGLLLGLQKNSLQTSSPQRSCNTEL